MEVKLQSLRIPLGRRGLWQHGSGWTILGFWEHYQHQWSTSTLGWPSCASLHWRAGPHVQEADVLNVYWHMHVCICVFQTDVWLKRTSECWKLLRCEGVCLCEGGWVCRRVYFSCVFLLRHSRLAFIVLTEPIRVYLSSNWMHPSGRHRLFIPWHREGTVCVSMHVRVR